jgi:hypothetical protein
MAIFFPFFVAKMAGGPRRLAADPLLQVRGVAVSPQRDIRA